MCHLYILLYSNSVQAAKIYFILFFVTSPNVNHLKSFEHLQGTVVCQNHHLCFAVCLYNKHQEQMSLLYSSNQVPFKYLSAQKEIVSHPDLTAAEILTRFSGIKCLMCKSRTSKIKWHFLLYPIEKLLQTLYLWQCLWKPSFLQQSVITMA